MNLFQGGEYLSLKIDYLDDIMRILVCLFFYNKIMMSNLKAPEGYKLTNGDFNSSLKCLITYLALRKIVDRNINWIIVRI